MGYNVGLGTRIGVEGRSVCRVGSVWWERSRGGVEWGYWMRELDERVES